MNTILNLPLKAKWYNMIENGEKKEEYREIKPYWIKRLLDGGKKFDIVKFSYGYTKKTMEFKCLGISKGLGNKDWGAPTNSNVFIIKLGKRLK